MREGEVNIANLDQFDSDSEASTESEVDLEDFRFDS